MKRSPKSGYTIATNNSGTTRISPLAVWTLIIPIAFLFAGCGAQQTSAQSAAQQGTVTGPPGAAKDVTQRDAARATAASNVIQSQVIRDPMLNNMPAVTVHFPAKWHFEGAIFQANHCINNPYPVMRATSPDGLSLVEQLPKMGWTWSSGPFAQKNPDGCLPLSGPMSARDFLKYLAGTMKVDSVADEPVPAELLAKTRQANQNLAKQFPGMKPQTQELARAIVHYRNGTFAMEGRLAADVICHEMVLPGLSRVAPYNRGQPIRTIQEPATTLDTCMADVVYLTGPESQFAALTQQWEAPALAAKMEPAWFDALAQRSARSAKAFADYAKGIADEDTRRTQQAMQAQQQAFNRQQAVQQQMHNEFLATMQRGTNLSMQRTQANMYARSTAASDWVDYALDQKTVMDPNTGQLNKVSSSYSYTWVDSTGKVGYQTNWADANPNGVLPGTWTRQQVVHGNGAP